MKEGRGRGLAESKLRWPPHWGGELCGQKSCRGLAEAEEEERRRRWRRGRGSMRPRGVYGKADEKEEERKRRGRRRSRWRGVSTVIDRAQ
eukprot:2136923-Rhodomonas_salina.1